MSNATVINQSVTRRIYCPLCAERAKVVQVELVAMDPHHWYRIHLECTGKCDLLWSCVDVTSL